MNQRAMGLLYRIHTALDLTCHFNRMVLRMRKSQCTVHGITQYFKLQCSKPLLGVLHWHVCWSYGKFKKLYHNHIPVGQPTFNNSSIWLLAPIIWKKVAMLSFSTNYRCLLAHHNRSAYFQKEDKLSEKKHMHASFRPYYIHRILKARRRCLYLPGLKSTLQCVFV